MKIALLIHSMAGGGAERVTAILANAWQEEGHQVQLITFSGVELDAYRLIDGVIRVGLNSVGDSTGIVQAITANLKRAIAVRSKLVDFQADVLICMMTSASITGLLASCGLDIPVIVSERTYPPMLPLSKVWEIARKLTYPRADRVVMLSEKGLSWLCSTIPQAKGVVIPNPISLPLPIIEPNLCVESFIKNGRKLVLAAGRLDEGKQFNQLIAAFAGLHEKFKDWDLVILGDGPLRSELNGLVASLSLSENIKLIGRVGNIGQWYERADLYVMTSRFEGFPNVLAEAMAHGCAAISYDCDTGPRDIIRHQIDGLLVRPVGDLQKLQESMDELMLNNVKREKMGSFARETADRFSKVKITRQWAELIKECVSSRKI